MLAEVDKREAHARRVDGADHAQAPVTTPGEQRDNHSDRHVQRRHRRDVVLANRGAGRRVRTGTDYVLKDAVHASDVAMLRRQPRWRRRHKEAGKQAGVEAEQHGAGVEAEQLATPRP